MTTIYLVQGSVCYEYTDVIKAFVDEDKANEFIKECEDYDKSRSNTELWKTNHPAGGIYYDYYEVQRIELE